MMSRISMRTLPPGGLQGRGMGMTATWRGTRQPHDLAIAIGCQGSAGGLLRYARVGNPAPPCVVNGRGAMIDYEAICPRCRPRGATPHWLMVGGREGQAGDAHVLVSMACAGSPPG